MNTAHMLSCPYESCYSDKYGLLKLCCSNNNRTQLKKCCFLRDEQVNKFSVLKDLEIKPSDVSKNKSYVDGQKWRNDIIVVSLI